MLERVPTEAERGRQHHPVDVAGEARLRRVEVTVRVEPQHAAGAVAPQAGERPERDGVVTAEHERHVTLLARPPDERRHLGARGLDLLEEAQLLVALRLGLGHRRGHVAPVGALAAELLDSPFEPGVANRGRAHVHAAPVLAEVERRADDGDGL